MRLQRKILIACIIALLLLPALCLAAPAEIIAEGSYVMGDGETPLVAEERALLAAKRTALEQAGTYVESFSQTQGMVLTKDEINVIAAGVMEVTVLEKKRAIEGDGFKFWVRIKATVKPDSIGELAARAKDKQVVEDYKRLQADYEQNKQESSKLKQEFMQKEDYSSLLTTLNERAFSSIQWAERGYEYQQRKNYSAALECYIQAITINKTIIGVHERWITENPGPKILHINGGLATYRAQERIDKLSQKIAEIENLRDGE